MHMGSLFSTGQISLFTIFKKNSKNRRKSTHQVSFQLYQECVNVQQNMLVQGALVLFLYNTIAVLPHPLIYAFAILVYYLLLVVHYSTAESVPRAFEQGLEVVC
jgi:hypothetical protein